MGHNYYGTEHLLIGLTTTGLESVKILAGLGLEAVDVRNEVLALLGHFPADTIRSAQRWTSSRKQRPLRIMVTITDVAVRTVTIEMAA